MKKITAVITALLMLLLCGCSINTDTLKQKAEALMSGTGSSKAGNYTFTEEEYPKIGCTLSTLPLGVTFTSAALGVSAEQAEKYISFSLPMTESYKALCDGELDMVIAYAPDKAAKKYASKKAVTLEMTPICRDALVFICAGDNKVSGLSIQQIKNIYSGKTTSWRDLGGSRTDITAYQRIEGSDSRRLFDKLIGLGDKLMTAPTMKRTDAVSGSSETLADYDNSEGALGYMPYYYLNNVEKDRLSFIKMLSVDGVSPSKETISSGEYPLTGEIYVVIKSSAEKESSERILYNWICSSQASQLIEKENYPIAPLS